jgi:exonuclease III
MPCRPLLSALVLFVFAQGAPAAEPQPQVVRIAAWNVHEGFTPEGVKARSADLSSFAARVRPDVLIIEEVTSQAAAEAVRDAMGLTGYHVACSDFAPGDAPDFSAFEVAILSRFPITQAIEYDPSPDNVGKPGAPAELPISPLLKIGQTAPEQAERIRGFLWVRIDALKLTAVAVHLKSSRGNDGEEDRANAALREFVAAAVVDSVAQDLRLYPGYTCLVAGDFNVGHSDAKNGSDLNREDLVATATSDGYDETHAMLGGGLLGLKMRNLSGAIRDTTFPGINSTPIDNIYVAGAAADKFTPAVLEMETFGSDHRPVITTWPTTPRVDAPLPPNFATGVPTPPTKPSPGAPAASGVVVAPADVAKHLNGRCTVEFEVRAANVQPSTPPIGFLNSEADFRSDQNFTAVVFDEGLKKFAAAGITDFAAHFKNRRVRVTGQVSQRRDRYQIVVSDPQQIELLK